MTSELTFDPFDAEQTQGMWGLMKEFRERAPVARIGHGFVYVSRYEDVRTVLRDETTYSNAGGMRPTGLEIPLYDASIGELIPPVHPPVRRLAFSAAQGGGVVETLRPIARRVSDELLEEIDTAGRGDLIGGLSLPLTNRVIGALLGIGRESCDRLAAWSEEIMLSPLTVTNETERGVGYEGAFPEFTTFLDALILEREANVAVSAEAADREPDTITRIMRGGLEIAELDIRMIRMILLNLVLGGTATTRDFLGNLLLVLLENPALYAMLHADRELVPRALEESLRRDPPVLYLIRTCTRATELAGVAIDPGERVIASIASANRDERIYAEPDAFRLDRVEPQGHFSFGYGKHFCVGSALARMEVEEAMQAILDRYPPGALTLTPGFQAEMMPLPYMLGPRSLSVRVVKSLA
jgi:cytochrome P450